MKFTFRVDFPDGVYTEVSGSKELDACLTDSVEHGAWRLNELKITIVKCEVVDNKTHVVPA